VIPPAIITGQAAAEAAALAIEERGGVSEVSIRTLQARLASENVMIHFPDAYVPADVAPALDTHCDVGHL
jgi:hypothetical protein